MKPVPRPCKYCRRPTTNANGFCDDHQDKYKDPRRLYDDRRGSPSKRGYDAAWTKFRAWYLANNPLCVMCQKEGLLTPANEVHHIKPLIEGGARLDENNCMALCHSCHSKITAEWRGGRK